MNKFLTRHDLTGRRGIGFGLLVVLTAFVYLFDLGINKWANAYYSAAAQAGAQSWSAFWFGAFNSTGSITVDKPPLSIWFMSLSVRLFGLNSYAIILPQALMGIATVALLFFIIRRYFGYGAGLVAGFALLITPVAALMFRFNNPDALLTLFMVLAVWATTRLNDSGRLRWAVILGAFLGLAFMTKTFQAFLILPALFIAFIFFGKPALVKRLISFVITAVLMVVFGGAWLFAIYLTPAADRPYIGSSQKNSVIDLAFGYNGFGRLLGMNPESGTYVRNPITEPHWFRLFAGAPGGGIGWLLPLALATCVVALVLFFNKRKAEQKFFMTALLGIAMVTMILLFSFMKGIFHAYYTVQLAPFAAALIGVFYYLTQLSKTNSRLRLILAAMIFGNGIYAALVPALNNDTDNALVIPMFALGVIAALCFAIPYRLTEGYSKFLAFAVVAAIGAGPASYTFSTLLISQTGSDVRAGPYVRPITSFVNKPTPIPSDKPANVTKEDRQKNTVLGIANLANIPQISPATVAVLDQDADKYRYVAGVVGGQNAAGYQLALNRPILLMGGFNGTDPNPTLAQFKQMIEKHEIHYFVLSSGGQGTDSVEFQITIWVMNHFPGKLVGNVKLYDLTKPYPGTFN